MKNEGNASIDYASAVREAGWLKIQANGNGTLAPNEERAIAVEASCGSSTWTTSGKLVLLPLNQAEIEVPVTLTCTQTETPAGHFAPLPPVEGDVITETTKRFAISLTNAGGRPLTYDSYLRTGRTVSIKSGAKGTIEAGQARTLEVEASCGTNEEVLEDQLVLVPVNQSEVVVPITINCKKPTAEQLGKFAPVDPITVNATVDSSGTGSVQLKNIGQAPLRYVAHLASGTSLSLAGGGSGVLKSGEVNTLQIYGRCGSAPTPVQDTLVLLSGSSSGGPTAETKVPVTLNCVPGASAPLEVRFALQDPKAQFGMSSYIDVATVNVQLIEQASGRVIASQEKKFEPARGIDTQTVEFENVANGSYRIVGKVLQTGYNLLDASLQEVKVEGVKSSVQLRFPLTSHEPNILQGRVPVPPTGAQVQLRTPLGVSNATPVASDGTFKGELLAPVRLERAGALALAEAAGCEKQQSISDPEALVSFNSLDPRTLLSTTEVKVNGVLIGTITEQDYSQNTYFNVGRVYADRPVTISASIVCPQGMFTQRLSLSLKKGWNYVSVQNVALIHKSIQGFSSPGVLVRTGWSPQP